MNPLTWFFGSYCARHDTYYRSDFCPCCVQARIALSKRSEEHAEVYINEEWWSNERTD